MTGARLWEGKVEPHLSCGLSRAGEVGRGHGLLTADFISVTTARALPHRPWTEQRQSIHG